MARCQDRGQPVVLKSGGYHVVFAEPCGLLDGHLCPSFCPQTHRALTQRLHFPAKQAVHVHSGFAVRGLALARRKLDKECAASARE
jgi:hypothetical protein